MARIRSVKPEFWTDPDIVALPVVARLFFIGMWNHADDYGVLKDDPARLKLQILPADDIDPTEIIDALVAANLLLRKVAPDGTGVLVVRTFEVHQKIDKRAVGRWGHPSEFTDSHPVTADPAQSPPIPTTPDLGLERTGLDGTLKSTAPAPPAEIDRFPEFWTLWPSGRKVKKPQAQQAWASALKQKTAPDDILDGLARWVTYWTTDRTEDRFIPHPATWLNAQQWNDPTPAPKRPEGKKADNALARQQLLGSVLDVPALEAG